MPAKTKRAIGLSPEEARDLTLFILSQPDEFTADDIHQSYPFLTRNQIVNKVSRMYGEGLLDVVGRNPNNKMNQFLYISQSRPREDPEILIARLMQGRRYEDFIPKRLLANARTSSAVVLRGPGLRNPNPSTYLQPIRDVL
jgi:hypothetical protein